MCLRVLIADDDPLARMDLRVLLEELGHTVVAEAASGFEACRLARALMPSIAVLDVLMPNGSGVEAAAAMAAERLCPVVLSTGYADIPQLAEAVRAGIVGYLVKPYSRQSLHATLEVAVMRYRELRALETERETFRGSQRESDRVGEAVLTLAHREGITVHEARVRLERKARQLGVNVERVAEALLLMDDLRRQK